MLTGCTTDKIPITDLRRVYIMSTFRNIAITIGRSFLVAIVFLAALGLTLSAIGYKPSQEARDARIITDKQVAFATKKCRNNLKSCIGGFIKWKDELDIVLIGDPSQIVCSDPLCLLHEPRRTDYEMIEYVVFRGDPLWEKTAAVYGKQPV
jgi:hypothetical protein